MTSSLAIIAIATMLILAFGIIFFVVLYQRRIIKHQQELNTLNKQKELELVQASVRGEEEERTRIASELHDDVGATLASVKLFLHSRNKEFGDGPVFAQSRELIDDTINKVRNLSHRLQPAVLKQLGLNAALQSFFDGFNRSSTIHIQFQQTSIPRLSDDAELGLYRIVQELTNNTVKHAYATQVIFICYRDNDTLVAKFMHNGSGLTEESFHEHIYKKDAIGLKNIVTRLKAIDGRISFDREQNMSVTQIILPYDSNQVRHS